VAADSLNGVDALYSNTSGNNNTADGFQALYSVSGNNNIAVGFNAGQNLTTGNYNIDIGNPGSPGEETTINIGQQGAQTSTFIAGIYNNVSFNGTPLAVQVDAVGKLGVAGSSERFKQNIQSMAGASGVLLSLRPVTFRYKPEIDPKGIPQFGLVAEEVDKVDPDLVVRDGKNQIYTVRYEAVNAMLLNEFQKEHKKVEAQATEIQDLKQQLAATQQELASRLARLEKAVARVAETSAPTLAATTSTLEEK
jgi:hypothetical protein